MARKWPTFKGFKFTMQISGPTIRYKLTNTAGVFASADKMEEALRLFVAVAERQIVKAREGVVTNASTD